ncbi:lactococcin 972 family bacteriocin [Anaerococcus sp. Marseille-Q7828]|uniref:lactococcin 972 family bacteriocin n=1 Tax=Anaerococcus sp. Marseille-Q7828 TaxID=3036300 RepID=UPI0024AD15C4|nr:lactococcin 972 family bacteriocin [Anaerococcus sp. Marseille-Q7828]
MKKIKTILSIVSLSTLLTSVAFASVEVDGGIWSYGGVHEVGNWGAFSNYYHPSRYHYSRVVRGRDSKDDTKYAGAGNTSQAFIHTKIGEKAYFYYGF